MSNGLRFRSRLCDAAPDDYPLEAETLDSFVRPLLEGTLSAEAAKVVTWNCCRMKVSSRVFEPLQADLADESRLIRSI